MLAASHILVLCVQIGVLLLVAGVFWRPVAAVVLFACGLCGVAFALVGQGSVWLAVGVFALFCAWRSLQVSFLQVKYAGLDVFRVKAPEKAPSETELLDKLVARMSELNAARQERAAAAKAAAAKMSTQTQEQSDAAQTGGRRARTAERLSSTRRLSRPTTRRELPGRTVAEAEAEELPALPHSPEERKKRLDTSKTSPKAVA